jgi:hypothetical protein
MLTGRPDQQELLNELEGAINKGAVRRTKVGYMRGLIARQREGTFDPDLGIAVHEAREERARTGAYLAKLDEQARNCTPKARLPPGELRAQLLAKLREKQLRGGGR